MFIFVQEKWDLKNKKQKKKKIFLNKKLDIVYNVNQD